MAEGWIESDGEGDALVLRAGGRWRLDDAAALDRVLAGLRLPASRRVRIDLSAIDALDTAGAFLVLRLERALEAQGMSVSLENVAPEIEPLLHQVGKGAAAPPPARRRHESLVEWIARLGVAAVDVVESGAVHLAFLGIVVITCVRSLRHPHRVRLVSLVAQMERVGVTALPIVGLLSFVIGAVTAYQGAYQLAYFGAQILTVNLLGIGFLREMGVMLAAVIVAGRSGSAFTAELGTMQVNEEIDALRTLALDPVELLVLPRVFALTLVMPLIAFWANAMGLLGGAIVCWVALGISLPTYSQQLHEALSIWSFWLGIIKAPFFGATIALVGCREGLNVERSAASLGSHTTRSVVHSIFLVILIDAAFSILFSWLRV
jgi:phospholipid/cholesterol/gamma-HCH transport system permease protein